MRAAQEPLSIEHGTPLSDEPGLGALTLPGYLREVTQRYADREVLVMHHDDGQIERWRYEDLWSRSIQVARALIAAGVDQGSRVGVMMTNRPEWLSAFFGASLAGAVATPLSTFSTAAELEVLLKASSVSVLLFEGRVLKKDFADALRQLDPAIEQSTPGRLASLGYPFLRRLVAVGGGASRAIEDWADFLHLGDAVDPALVEARAAAIKPADVGVLFFSSGSTGVPKGILSAHRGVTIQCWRWRRMLALPDEGIRCWCANGFFFSGNFAGALGATLSSGGSNVLQPTFDAPAALELMQDEKVTRAYAWPHQYEQLEGAPNWSTVDLSSLLYVDADNRLGRHPTVKSDYKDPNEAYGNTETFTLMSAFPSGTPRALAEGTHGRPLPGNTLRIVDPLSGETLPRGERGEIAVKGPTLMLGYLGTPLDETLDTEGFFRTADGGYFDEQGRLHWEGRLNDIIKTGGANVSPLEVDAVLARCPGVQLARTVGVPHESLGEMIVACVVAHDGVSLSEVEVRDFLKKRLASYKLPRRVLFVSADDLALTGSAKIKLPELRALAQRTLDAEKG